MTGGASPTTTSCARRWRWPTRWERRRDREPAGPRAHPLSRPLDPRLHGGLPPHDQGAALRPRIHRRRERSLECRRTGRAPFGDGVLDRHHWRLSGAAAHAPARPALHHLRAQVRSAAHVDAPGRGGLRRRRERDPDPALAGRLQHDRPHADPPARSRRRIPAFGGGIALLRVGDRIKFDPVDRSEYDRIEAKLADGSFPFNIVAYQRFSLSAYEAWVASLDAEQRH